MTVNRRAFIVGAAASAAAAGMATDEPRPTPARPALPHRSIDRERCVGCGSCVPLCPMGAITLSATSSIDPDECAECGVCLRSRVCPADAILAGELGWPRTLRATFSDPLAVHKETGVGGRGTEGIKTNDSACRYGPDDVGVFVELGRPVLGTRFREVERVVRGFAAAGFTVRQDNPVAALVADPRTGALQPEVLDEKALSVLVEFVLPRARAAELLDILDRIEDQVETVFNVSVALRADTQCGSPLGELFGTSLFSLPNGKVNVGMAGGIVRPCPTPRSAAG